MSIENPILIPDLIAVPEYQRQLGSWYFGFSHPWDWMDLILADIGMDKKLSINCVQYAHIDYFAFAFQL